MAKSPTHGVLSRNQSCHELRTRWGGGEETWPDQNIHCQWQWQWHLDNTLKEQSQMLVTCKTLITFLTIDNNNLNINCCDPWILAMFLKQKGIKEMGQITSGPPKIWPLYGLYQSCQIMLLLLKIYVELCMYTVYTQISEIKTSNNHIKRNYISEKKTSKNTVKRNCPTIGWSFQMRFLASSEMKRWSQ